MTCQSLKLIINSQKPATKKKLDKNYRKILIEKSQKDEFNFNVWEKSV
jgi:hypothetical protein